MSHATANTILQVIRIRTVFQHLRIIICFQESSMALFKMADELFATNTKISKHANIHRSATDHKTMRIACIMDLGKSSYGKRTDGYGFVWNKGYYRSF